MITCDECTCEPITYFVEMIGDKPHRTLCLICTAHVAVRYVARAKRRTERARTRTAWRKQEAAQ